MVRAADFARLYHLRTCQSLDNRYRPTARISWLRLYIFLLLWLYVRGGMGQVELIDVYDVIQAEDLQSGGNCGTGCVRELSYAVASVAGEAKCDVVVQNLLDHQKSDVRGGTLNIVHACTDSEGNLKYQGSGECLYSVCAYGTWAGGKMLYSIVLQHEETSLPHSIRVQVYLNQAEDLIGLIDDDAAGSASLSSSNTFTCSIGDTCPSPTGCLAGTTIVEIVTEDDYGDGWVGALPDRINTWTVSDGSDTLISSTLSGGHYSNRTDLCLADGTYTISSTADASWSSEASWALCGGVGAAGGSLDFEVSGGSCSIVDDSEADGPPETNARTDPYDYCSLPSASPCVALDVGISELSGPSVGMYYDEACLDGGGGQSGCGGGGVSACRICFVNRDNWMLDFGNKRYPDWGDCPCCVAEALGVTCQGGFDGSSKATVMEIIEEHYIEGGVPVLAALAACLCLCISLAICCVRSISREKATLASMRKARSTLYDDYNAQTSTDTTPPGASLPKATVITGDDDNGEKRQPSQAKNVEAGAEVGSKSRSGSGNVGPQATKAPNSADAFFQASRRLAVPQVVGQPTPTKSPTIEKASSPKPTAGSQPNRNNEGKKPRWSGGQDARAFLGAGTYNKMESLDSEFGLSPPSAPDGRRSGGFTRSRSANRVMQALVTMGNRKSSSKIDANGKAPASGGDVHEVHIVATSNKSRLPTDVAGVDSQTATMPPPPPSGVAPVPSAVVVAPLVSNELSRVGASKSFRNQSRRSVQQSELEYQESHTDTAAAISVDLSGRNFTLGSRQLGEDQTFAREESLHNIGQSKRNNISQKNDSRPHRHEPDVSPPCDSTIGVGGVGGQQSSGWTKAWLEDNRQPSDHGVISGRSSRDISVDSKTKQPIAEHRNGDYKPNGKSRHGREVGHDHGKVDGETMSVRRTTGHNGRGSSKASRERDDSRGGSGSNTSKAGAEVPKRAQRADGGHDMQNGRGAGVHGQQRNGSSSRGRVLQVEYSNPMGLADRRPYGGMKAGPLTASGGLLVPEVTKRSGVTKGMTKSGMDRDKLPRAKQK